MASATKQTTFRRKMRHDKAGKKAKSLRARNGSTPAFPIHTAEADANAPQEARQEG